MILTFIAVACAQDGGSGRVRPPEDLPCSRDQLTAYMGEVAEYSRTASAAKLTIHTDWRTTETAELLPRAGEPIEERFRINGERFSARDFAKIEVDRGRLKPGMRANVWVCEGSGPVLVDWRPKS